MGQNASKVASKVSSRVSNATSKSVQQHPRATVAKVSQSDPHAVHGGFTRGQGPDNPRDEVQRKFLESKMGGKTEYKEMPSDLIKFLKDVGPLKPDPGSEERKSRKSKQSGPRAPRKQLGEREKLQSQRRESMPLAENIEGFETLRTTNFSSKEDPENPKDFGVGDVLDFYDLLKRRASTGSIDEASKSFFKKKTKGRENVWSDEEKEQHLRLLRGTFDCIEIPVLMKDTDDSYVGAWPENVADLKRLKIVELPKNKAKLVLDDLNDKLKEEEIDP